ncbi:S8 family serine peptidase [Hydrogenophaga sp. MI9]|uniref:S8 family serine peptidase n=1 Tax=Hydrogenophaga sp. MI9 TaxID=3453719 RepID=UPI003EEDDF6D
MSVPILRQRRLWAFCLALGTSAALHAQPVPSAALDRLTELVATQGHVRVIIGMKVDPAAGASGTGAAGATDLHKRANSAQNKLEAEFPRGGSSKILSRFNLQPHIVADVDAGTLAHLKMSPLVASIEEDTPVPLTLAESTPQIGAVQAWSNGVTGAGQSVAVLDTGVDKTHPMLSGKVVAEACYSSNTTEARSVCPGSVTDSTASGSGVNCATSISGCSHGTHVAGIVAGNGGSAGTYGVAPGAQIIAIQVFSYFPSYGAVMSYTSDQIKGLERVYALKDALKIASVNMSLGGGQYTSNCDADRLALKAAIDNLRSVGIATVIASGNNGWTSAMSAPACISTAVSVGAHCDAGPDGSACATGVGGIASYSNITSFVSLVAPGSYIRSSVPGNAYATYNGTSMATPHVAGAWALLRQAQPAISVTEGLALLRQQAVSVNDTRSGGSVTGLKRLQTGFLSTEATTLSVQRNGTGSGIVSSTPSGILCGGDCSETYSAGTSVALVATAATGSVFSGWSGACSGTAGCTVSMALPRSVTATFTATRQTLSVTRLGDGTGTVTSSPSGISCGTTCSASMVAGATVKLAAVAAKGSKFTGWTGACSGTASCTVAMNTAITVGAKFERLPYTLSYSKAGTGGGSVTVVNTGTVCGATCSASFLSGTLVRLTASPDAYSNFTGWSGACSGAASCVVSMDNVKKVTANFKRVRFTLTATVQGTGGGHITTDGLDCTGTCQKLFENTSKPALSATASSGWRFVKWTGACRVTMSGDKAVTALFAPL